jgi:hypothetical protein
LQGISIGEAARARWRSSRQARPFAGYDALLDSTQWRLVMLAAALEAVRKEWPQSAKWPLAFAGFSGGSKRGGTLG